MSLGKLAAGLAHELNNPAAAIQQRAEAHARRLDALSALAVRALDPTTAAALQSRARAPLGSAGAAPILAALERSEAEEALTSWLEARDVPVPWRAAETFVGAGWSTTDLERLTDGIPNGDVAASLEWLTADLALDLVRRIVERNLGDVALESQPSRQAVRELALVLGLVVVATGRSDQQVVVEVPGLVSVDAHSVAGPPGPVFVPVKVQRYSTRSPSTTTSRRTTCMSGRAA